LKRSGTITSSDSVDINSEIHSIFSNYKSIGIACHDAGASEIISEICLRLNSNVTINYCLSGPAVQIFKKKSLFIKNNSKLAMIMNSDLILTGTGWETDLEYLALENSKKINTPCYVVLDHFQHFRSRFMKKDGQYIFPDKIIVTNLYTLHVVKSEIPEVPVIPIPDIYIESLLKHNTFFRNNFKPKKSEILYLSDGQPYNQQSEFSQISQLIKIVNNYTQIVKFIGTEFSKVSIRPHPADLNGNRAPTKLGEINFEEANGNLETLINSSILVIGTDSLAMYAAMRLGARTLTVINDKEKPLWLDFAATLNSINDKNIKESMNNLHLCDDQTGTYVRKFTLLDIDSVHLKNQSFIIAQELCEFNDIHSSFAAYFSQVYKELGADCMHFSVMNYKNIRIGIVAIRLNTADSLVVVKPYGYSDPMNLDNYNSGMNLLIDFLKVTFHGYRITIER
jgi:hypothetical protein